MNEFLELVKKVNKSEKVNSKIKFITEDISYIKSNNKIKPISISPSENYLLSLANENKNLKKELKRLKKNWNNSKIQQQRLYNNLKKSYMNLRILTTNILDDILADINDISHGYWKYFKKNGEAFMSSGDFVMLSREIKEKYKENKL